MEKCPSLLTDMCFSLARFKLIGLFNELMISIYMSEIGIGYRLLNDIIVFNSISFSE